MRPLVPVAAVFTLLTLPLLGACSRDEKPRLADPLPTSKPVSEKPATEKLVVVTSPEAPLMNELEDDEDAAEVVMAGDLLRVVRPMKAMKWHASMGGHKATREGDMVEVERAGSAKLWGWRADVGTEVDVPTAAWICGEVARTVTGVVPDRCAGALRRVQTKEGAILAYATCSIGPCPVALIRGERLTAIAVDGVTLGEHRVVADKTMLLLTSRWVRAEGTWTGADLVPVDVSGSEAKRGAEIPLDIVDARGADEVTTRLVHFELRADAVHLTGETRKVVRATAKELAKSPVDETRPIVFSR